MSLNQDCTVLWLPYLLLNNRDGRSGKGGRVSDFGRIEEESRSIEGIFK